MHGATPTSTRKRSETDEQAFREAHWLLVAFGASGLPATLLLVLMGVDFLEGDFGLAGTLAMMLAGGTPIVCVAAGVAARRAWADGGSLGRSLAVMCWPPLLTLIGVCASLFAYTARLSFLLEKP